MFNYRHYVPILRWKAGERIALRELHDDDKISLTPLIEITSDTVENGLKKMSLAQFTQRLCTEILECWGRRSAFLDLTKLTARIAPNQRSEFLHQFYRQASTLGLVPVPVVGLGNTSIAGVGNNVCLRLFRDDVESEGLAHEINKWL